jgi:D-alanyl-D-alanine carboxypeptidase
MSARLHSCALSLLVFAGIGGGVHAQSALPPARLLDILVAAYPDFLERHDGGALIWKDGTRLPLGEAKFDGAAGQPAAAADALFATPSLRDMFHWPYPADTPAPSPNFPSDPGRIRVGSFFAKMYGDCRRNEVAARLVPVAWLPRKKGGTVRITRINGVAEKLAAVSAELDELPASFDKYLIPSAGGYHCRPIAGTDRLSAHATGTAIDLAVKHADYWRWTKPGVDGRYPYRNSFPPEIVRVFERHGFIWGGKWYHYDTMHFEYRPEILAASRL